MMLAPAGGCTNEKRAGQGRLHAGGYIRRHLGSACHRVVAFSFAVATGIATEGGRDFRDVDFPGAIDGRVGAAPTAVRHLACALALSEREGSDRGSDAGGTGCAKAPRVLTASEW